MQHLTHPHKMARRQLLTRRLVGVTFVAALCLATVATAAADPIAITAGTISAAAPGSSSPSPASFTGVPSFSFVGVVISGEGRIDPFGECLIPCFPGSTISVGGVLLGGAIPGVATFHGTRYRVGGVVTNENPNSLYLDLVGAAIVPPLGGVSARITAPFTMTGTLFTGVFAANMTGQGVASVWFRSEPLDEHSSGWSAERVQYTFSPSTPVPEPATLGTLAFGLAALARTAHKRRSRRSMET